jgi:hypothetical protein
MSKAKPRDEEIGWRTKLDAPNERRACKVPMLIQYVI